MAGIGFELKKLLKKDTYFHIIQAYGYAGIITAGPAIISLLGILFISLIRFKSDAHHLPTLIFQTTIVFLISVSLVFSGLFQQSFVRFIADRIYKEAFEDIMPNIVGAIITVTATSGLFAILLIMLLIPQQNTLFKLLFLSNFVVLCNIWVLTGLLTSLKNYKAIVVIFFLGYGSGVFLAQQSHAFQQYGLLFSFLIGQVILLLGFWMLIIKNYASKKFVSFKFLKHKNIYYSLVFSGFFFNLGIWIDKYLFWYTPYTGHKIIGLIASSPIYDTPFFLAYLTILPGMAIFLFRMETDFVYFYRKYYDAITGGGTLDRIYTLRNEMLEAAKQGIFEIIKVQALIFLAVYLLGNYILQWLGISQLYAQLLNLDTIAAGLQITFLAISNIMFYLDKRYVVLTLNIVFCVSNFALTLITLHLGVFYFGYGIALSLLIVCISGMYLIDKHFSQLEYETFMLQT